MRNGCPHCTKDQLCLHHERKQRELRQLVQEKVQAASVQPASVTAAPKAVTPRAPKPKVQVETKTGRPTIRRKSRGRPVGPGPLWDSLPEPVRTKRQKQRALRELKRLADRRKGLPAKLPSKRSSRQQPESVAGVAASVRSTDDGLADKGTVTPTFPATLQEFIDMSDRGVRIEG